MLTLDEFEKIARNFFPFTSIALTGGEPFLRDDLDKIAYLFYKHSKVRSIFVPTNGSLPDKISSQTESILKKCPEALVTICLSLDGIGKLHDQIRGAKGAYDKFLIALEKLQDLKKRYSNLEINISFTYSKSNQNHLLKTYEELSNRRISNFNVSWVRGEARKKETKNADIEKYISQTSAIDRQAFAHLGMKKFGSIFGEIIFARTVLVKKLVARIVKKNERVLPCLAGQFNLVINEEGDVFPCEMLGEKLGSLREEKYNIEALMSKTRVKNVIKNIKDGKCTCTHEFNLPDNILYSPRGVKMLIEEWSKLRRENPKKRVLEINVFDENYAAYIRSRKIKELFRSNGWQVIYSEANYLGKDESIASISQQDSAIGFGRGLWRRLALVLRSPYDLLFLHQLIPLTVPLMIVAKLRGKKVAFDWDDLASGVQSSRLRSWLCQICELPPVIRLADFVTAHNDQLFQMAKQAGVKKTYYLPQGIDTDLFDAAKYKKSNRELAKKLGLGGKKVFVCAVHFNTGGVADLDMVLGAFAVFSRSIPKSALLILGGGPLLGRYKTMVKKRKIKGVRFLGKLSHDKIPAYLSLAHAGLVYMRNKPGNRFKMSLKTLEYLSLPLPTIGRLVGETRKAVGRFCIESDHGSISLAETMVNFIKKKPGVANSRPYIIKNYSNKAMEKAFSDFNL